MRLWHKINDLSETDLCLLTMIILNFIIIAFSSILPSLTQVRIARSGSAMTFLGGLHSIPMHPWLKVYLAIAIYILIAGCVLLKKVCHDLPGQEFFYLSVFEIFLVALEMGVLEMSYNGLIFLLLAEFLSYVGTRKKWMLYLLGSFLIYLFCNRNFIGMIFPVNTMEDWVSYYDSVTESYILGSKAALEVVNILMLFLYVALMIQRDKKEKYEIQSLNDRLFFTNEQLKHANEQLHTYALEKEQMGQTKERNRLAREIHDSLGHVLTGISVGTEAVQILMDISPDKAKEQLNTIGDMARNGLNDVRRSVHKLKPDTLEMLSLDFAIHQMVDELSATTGARIYFISYDSNLHFEEDEEETIYRLIQEGMTNALRHGKATEIWIRMEDTEQGIEILLSDNGIGCQKIEEGFGLTHMRERVEMLGGQISCKSESGFEIHAVIPVRKHRELEEENV